MVRTTPADIALCGNVQNTLLPVLRPYLCFYQTIGSRPQLRCICSARAHKNTIGFLAAFKQSIKYLKRDI